MNLFLILVSPGTAKEFLGIEINLGDIKELSDKDVKKCYTRYQTLLEKKVTSGLVESAISVTSKSVSTFVSIEDTEKWTSDLKNDQLVLSELSNPAGLLVLKGGRFVALASALFHVVRHVKIGEPPSPQSNAPTSEKGKLLKRI